MYLYLGYYLYLEIGHSLLDALVRGQLREHAEELEVVMEERVEELGEYSLCREGKMEDK